MGFFFMRPRITYWRLDERVIFSKGSRCQERRPSFGLDLWPQNFQVVTSHEVDRRGQEWGRGSWDAGKKLTADKPEVGVGERICWGRLIYAASTCMWPVSLAAPPLVGSSGEGE